MGGNPNMGNTNMQNQSTAYPPQQNTYPPQQNAYAHTTPAPQHSMYPNLTHNNSYPNQTTPANSYSHPNFQNSQQQPNFHHSPSLPQINSLNLNSGTTASSLYPVIPVFPTSGKKAIVRLIDFNNWQDGEGQIDEASLKGVRGLIVHLTEQLSYSED